MIQSKRAAFAQRMAAMASVVAMGVLLSACKDKAADPATPVASPSTAPAPTAPATPAPAPAAQVTPPPANATAAPRKVPMSVQGVSPAGVTVRVKSVDIGADATVVDVSISFANRINATTMLAMGDTFLEDENKGRLQLKRPESNLTLGVRQGETLDGQLVFLGAVPASAQKLRLVFNDGNEEDSIIAPGLSMELPLQAP